jgi:prenyltransferase beta subunit
MPNKTRWKNSTCSERMSETAGRACQLLDPESMAQIASFVKDQMVEDGGFRGRTDSSDLYYTFFGMECLRALGNTFPANRISNYLSRFKKGNGLDFVHLTCLVRCLAKLTDITKQTNAEQAILQKLKIYRSGGCGFRMTPDAKHDSIYATFLAFLAYEDSGMAIHDPHALICCIDHLKTKDGAYADQPGLSFGTTTVTAAAAVLLSYLGETVDSSVSNWLMACRSQHGGFLATPHAPVPDLLSTATALFALQTLQYPIEEIKESCLAFIEEMWDDGGGFCGHVFDNTPDCEYTFYGLFSLGILAGDIK